MKGKSSSWNNKNKIVPMSLLMMTLLVLLFMFLTAFVDTILSNRTNDSSLSSSSTATTTETRNFNNNDEISHRSNNVRNRVLTRNKGRSGDVGGGDSSNGRTLSIESFGAIPDSALGGNEKKNLGMFSEFFSTEISNSDTMRDDTPESALTIKRIALEKEHEEENIDDSVDITTVVALKNMEAFNMALNEAKAGDTVLLPANESFTFFGGITGLNLSSVTIDISGSAHFIHDLDNWPRIQIDKNTTGRYYPGISILNSTNITITCSTPVANRARVIVDYKKNEVYLDQTNLTRMGGIINGNGKKWWDDVIFGRMKGHHDVRPRLIRILSSTNILIENLTLLNSPYWTLTVEAIHAEIHHINVLVDRKYQGEQMKRSQQRQLMIEEKVAAAQRGKEMMTEHNINDNFDNSTIEKFPFPDDIPDWCLRKFHQPDDLNTDGIDPIGANIWIHDCIIQNADDSVAVKPPPNGIYSSVLHGTIKYNCTENITIQDTILTGFGASIGSVGPSDQHLCVNNVTFRNITMPGSGKGIYIKSNKCDCNGNESSRITNILYEDIYIKEPFWWPIWIGPQQQHQPHTSLSGDCPLLYPLMGHKNCPTQGCTTFENITLRNVTIEDPILSPGVILGNKTNPIKNILFDNVRLTGLSKWRPLHGKWPFHEVHYPFRPKYQSKNVQNARCRNCYPIPPGFKKA